MLLYDRLVPDVIIGRARRDAEKINVGKAPGSTQMTQAHINQLLIDHAQRGLRVARVQGGDPFIFGRGGEELAVLRAAGIATIVVPGITAALGAAASSGIALTQRGVSQSVTFVTATGALGQQLNWQALAQTGQTVVFYMGVAQIDAVVAALLQHGLPPSHPAALIERATWPDQRVLHCSVADLPHTARTADVQAPSLLILGEVTAAVLAGAGLEPAPTYCKAVGDLT